MRLSNRLAVLLGLLTVIPAEGASKVDVPAEQAAIREADLALAAATAAKDKEKFAALLADAMVSFPDKPVVGKQHFIDGWAAFFRPDDAPTITWRPDEVYVFPSGDLGFSRGTAQIRGHDKEGKPKASQTNYLTVWRKEQDGKWRALVDIGTDGVPIPVTR